MRLHNIQRPAKQRFHRHRRVRIPHKIDGGFEPHFDGAIRNVEVERHRKEVQRRVRKHRHAVAGWE